MLYDRSHAIPFSSWIRRFLYKRAGFTAPADQVPDSEYKAYMLQSFRDTRTPVSFSDSSVKLGKMIDTCLHAGHVSRETAFLIGLGLEMTAGEVSEMLVKGMHEQNFSERNPVDVIIWWALEHQLSSCETVELVRLFRDGEGNCLLPYAAGETPDLSTKEGLLRYVRLLAKELKTEKVRKMELFRSLFDRSMDLIRDLYASDPVFPGCGRDRRKITSADLESVLYSGIPKDERGNLFSCRKSCFGDTVSSYRLTRQRLARIFAGRAEIRAHDLLTLLFLVYGLTDFDDADSRYRAFQKEIRALRDTFSLSPDLPDDLYTTFLLLCLRTEWPLETFAFIRGLSYRNAV